EAPLPPHNPKGSRRKRSQLRKRTSLRVPERDHDVPPRACIDLVVEVILDAWQEDSPDPAQPPAGRLRADGRLKRNYLEWARQLFTKTACGAAGRFSLHQRAASSTWRN